GGRLGATARGVARGVTRFGRDRLVASGRGLQPCTGEKGASATGPSPVDRARSPAARPNTAPGSAACAGSSSEPSRGCTTTSGFPSATTAATRCTKQSSLSPAASSASGGERLSLRGHFLDGAGRLDLADARRPLADRGAGAQRLQREREQLAETLHAHARRGQREELLLRVGAEVDVRRELPRELRRRAGELDLRTRRLGELVEDAERTLDVVGVGRVAL